MRQPLGDRIDFGQQLQGRFVLGVDLQNHLAQLARLVMVFLPKGIQRIFV
jgi:hypothetical protein